MPDFNCNAKMKTSSKNQENSGQMELSDVKCPICLCIFIKPVTLPCLHELCFNCFTQHISETSAQCPLCRKRITTWARRAALNHKSIINEEKWKAIQQAFPLKVKRRLDGREDSDDDEGKHL